MAKPQVERRPHAAWGLDLAPLLDHPAYARMWSGGVVSGVGAQLTVVAVGVEVYQLTVSTFAVSLVGIFALVPMILIGVLGSTLVDAFDRRIVLIWAATASWLSAAGIAALAWAGNENVAPLYVLTTLSAVSSTLVGTARFAILPRLVPPRQLPAAAALSGVSAGVQATVGPALAGLLIAGVGFAWTYSIDVVLYTAAFLGIVTLPPIRPLGARIGLGPRSVVEGIGVLARTPALRGPFLLHLVATVFGRVQVLYPALSVLVIGGGPLTVGILGSSAAVGVISSSLLSGRLSRFDQHGLAVARAVAGFGSAILAFGAIIALTPQRGSAASPTDTVAVPLLVALCLALFCSGIADNVAGIFRTTMMQSEAPDALRGRIQGLMTVVQTAGPRMGDAWAGTTTLLAAAMWVGPVIGGAVIIGTALTMGRASSSLRQYRPGVGK
jgi:hypothetical protein